MVDVERQLITLSADPLGHRHAELGLRFSTEQATLVSVFWEGRGRARRLLPMVAL